MLKSTFNANRIICGALALAITLSACDKLFRVEGTDPAPIDYPDSCVAYQFDIRNLPYDSLPYTNYDSSDIIEPLEPADTGGVVYFEWKGKRYYHPVNMCQRALVYLDLFHQAGDSSNLSLALAYVDRLLAEADRFDSALYFPYRFDYKVNKRDDAVMKAPWYSGMAQGQALSAVVRAFELTCDSVYLDASGRIFSSLTRLRGQSEPWVAFDDSLGCYWIEEYPTSPRPSMTLNGFIFAIFGLYDYYQLTGRDDVRALLEKSLSTVENYIPSFRRPGRASFYGLTFHRYSGFYHMAQSKQLRQLALMTGDPFFSGWADTLAGDYTESIGKL